MSNNKRGRLFVITAPSGAGKTTLVRELMAQDPALCFSVSYTTRERRGNEVEGQDYYFVDPATFERMRSADEFLEHAEVFDHLYGTSRTQVEGLLNAGKNVMLEIDWQGAQQVRANLADCCSVFVLPPSVQRLEQRLRGRATDPEDVIQRRLDDALTDMAHWPEFSHVMINDDLAEALQTLQSIISGENTTNRTHSPAIRAKAESILN